MANLQMAAAVGLRAHALRILLKPGNLERCHGLGEGYASTPRGLMYDQRFLKHVLYFPIRRCLLVKQKGVLMDCSLLAQST